jgi:glutathione S-transferase
MKLYYSPGACSLACRIALNETGLAYMAEAVDLKSHEFKGGDFRKINPKGYVPTLELDNGQIMTEGPVVLQYIADQKPETQLMPASGTFERYRVEEWLNFIGTEIHKSFGPLFHSDSSASVLLETKRALVQKFAIVGEALKKSPFLIGEQCTVADFYLFVVLMWAKKNQIDLSAWPSLDQFAERIKAKPSVQAALRAEGLLH